MRSLFAVLLIIAVMICVVDAASFTAGTFKSFSNDLARAHVESAYRILSQDQYIPSANTCYRFAKPNATVSVGDFLNKGVQCPVGTQFIPTSTGVRCVSYTELFGNVVGVKCDPKNQQDVRNKCTYASQAPFAIFRCVDTTGGASCQYGIRYNGDSCVANQQCISGSCRNGVCTTVDDGASCVDTNQGLLAQFKQCKSSSFCSSASGYVCKAKLPVGSTCEPNALKENPLQCGDSYCHPLTKKCTAFLNENDVCDNGGICRMDMTLTAQALSVGNSPGNNALFCSPNTKKCTRMFLANGESCTAGSDAQHCASGLCNQGKCTARYSVAENGACDDAEVCQDGLVCSKNKCSQSQSVKCKTFADCLPGATTGNSVAGAYSTQGAQCVCDSSKNTTEGTCVSTCAPKVDLYGRCLLGCFDDITFAYTSFSLKVPVGYPFDKESCAYKKCAHLLSDSITCQAQRIQSVDPAFAIGTMPGFNSAAKIAGSMVAVVIASIVALFFL